MTWLGILQLYITEQQVLFTEIDIYVNMHFLLQTYKITREIQLNLGAEMI